jgi:hypothetical protein
MGLAGGFVGGAGDIEIIFPAMRLEHPIQAATLAGRDSR